MFDENTQTFTKDNPVVGDQNQDLPVVSPDTPISDNTVGSAQIPDQNVPLSTDQNSVDTNDSPVQDEDLMSIKKKALQQLAPLVHQLDQEPEEKFKTMLMMIQASDDKTMLSAAYETAQTISDEKSRAQALLDIVNEINYFTHPPKTD
jgi:hypothetical protein